MSHRRPIFENLRWLVLPGLVLKPLWFVFLLWSSRVLGPAQFGQAMLALSLVTIISVLLEGGLDMLIVRRLAANPGESPALLGRTIPLKALAGVVTIVIAAVIQLVVPAAGPGLPLVLAAGAVVALGQVNLHLRTVFKAFERMSKDAVASFVEKATIILLVGALLLIHPDPRLYLWGQAGALLVTLIVTGAMVRAMAGNPAWRLDATNLWKDVVRPALPFALMNIFAVIYFRSGTLALSLVAHRDDWIGYFNAGYRLVEAYMIFPATIVAPLFPVLVRTDADQEAISWRVREGFRAVLVLTLLSAGLLLLFPAEATHLGFGAAYDPAAGTVALLAASMFAIGFNFVFGTLVAASGRQPRANRWIVVVTLLNLGLNVVLIRWIGLIGAAVTTLVTESLLAAANIFVVRDRIPGRAILSLAVRGALVLGSGVIAAMVTRHAGWFPWNAAAVALLMVAVMAILRLVSWRDLTRFAGRT